MMDYSEIDELRFYYLEDSWVLDVVARPEHLTISLQIVLTRDHPQYQAPLPGERHCYRRGELRFEKVASLHWTGQGSPPAQDASGEFDYGGIDLLEVEQNDYRLSGDFGEISVRAKLVRVELLSDQDH